MRRIWKKRTPESNRRRHLKKAYGLTQADFDGMLAAQHGRCKICGRTTEGLQRRLSVDHDHKTGKVRGLLCIPCNRMLGWFENYRPATISYLGE